MNITNRATRQGLALALALALAGSAAADTYLGFGSGRAHLDDRIFGSSTEFKDDDSSEHFFFGIKLSRNVRLEAGRSDLGLLTDTVTFGVPTTTTYAVEGRTWDLIFSEPIADDMALYFRAGVFEWDREVVGPPAPGRRSGGNGHFGVGGSLRISERFTLRGEYQRFEVGGTNVDVPTLAIAYHF